MTVFDKIFQKYFNNFVKQNLGLEPDRIRIQQQQGSRSGFSKIHGSRSGESEYETIVSITEHENEHQSFHPSCQRQSLVSCVG
jgi:hypothetical protein